MAIYLFGKPFLATQILYKQSLYKTNTVIQCEENNLVPCMVLFAAKLRITIFSNLCSSFHLQYILSCKYIYSFQDWYKCTWQTNGNHLQEYHIYSILYVKFKNRLNRLCHQRFVLIMKATSEVKT